eukprot:CAMPEP_0116893160 /NCGR_PEP_ID=MMETSP0467-20121206/3216_1 /TAXON_ID=283647 /ORGANISM="Mesodinium pulex, Strain SPMC105" /LENGTH=31 /DNA_ID= /DNA_START= /DNA_END= /DNA_ORIENTATION=
MTKDNDKNIRLNCGGDIDIMTKEETKNYMDS